MNADALCGGNGTADAAVVDRLAFSVYHRPTGELEHPDEVPGDDFGCIVRMLPGEFRGVAQQGEVPFEMPAPAVVGGVVRPDPLSGWTEPTREG